MFLLQKLCIFANTIKQINIMKRKITTEEFIDHARKVHGNKYDYSKVNYGGSFVKVCIICPEHGEFWQTPANHLNGAGCSLCAGNIRFTTDDFVKKAREVHGDKYDYSQVVYLNYRSLVKIVCPEHGDFLQNAANHLHGRGCPKCGFAVSASKRTMSKDEFIQRAREVHGNKYDYSGINYVNTVTKIMINCPEHGDFEQVPIAHLNGSGCPKCVGKRKTTEDFINQARKIHGNKYDYSKVVYQGATTKVCIVCPEHGEFWQTPSMHLNGQGCPKCAGNVRMTKEKFIEKARKVHGDRYDYSRVEYLNNATPVIIKCPEHGEFLQRPAVHFRGCGCPKCSIGKKEKM